MLSRLFRALRRLLSVPGRIDTIDERLALLQTRADEIARQERALAERIEHVLSVSEEGRTLSRQSMLLSGDTLSALNDFRAQSLDVLDRARQAQGRIEAYQRFAANDDRWEENQFRIYSQFGEDGLLQLLLRLVPIETRTFVEFGVEDYQEANTRFLLLDRFWKGLVLDGSEENIAALKTEYAYWRRGLTAVAAFITRENINGLLEENGFSGPLGILSIDIDGNDYWVWEAIETVDPVIVVIEYNFRFGPTEKAVVPYDPAFVKTDAHPSAIYYGASLAALADLGRRKGYALVGCSRGGVNAFFVRRDRLPISLPERTPEEAYVVGQHAEMRDETGQVVPATFAEQQTLLLGLPLFRPEVNV